MNNNFEPIRKRKPFEGKSLSEQFKSMVAACKPEPKSYKYKRKEVVKSFPKGTKGAVRKLGR